MSGSMCLIVDCLSACLSPCPSASKPACFSTFLSDHLPSKLYDFLPALLSLCLGFCTFQPASMISVLPPLCIIHFLFTCFSVSRLICLFLSTYLPTCNCPLVTAILSTCFWPLLFLFACLIDICLLVCFGLSIYLIFCLPDWQPICRSLCLSHTF